MEGSIGQHPGVGCLDYPGMEASTRGDGDPELTPALKVRAPVKGPREEMRR